MKCPCDNTDLVRRPYEGDVMVDLCPTCHGAWLDPGELEAIEESHERKHAEELARMPDLGYNAYELAQQKSSRVLHCPRCAADMEAREYARCSQVMIDVCPADHGIWLDRGELDALEIFFERARAETRSVRRGFFRSLVSLFRRAKSSP